MREVVRAAGAFGVAVGLVFGVGAAAAPPGEAGAGAVAPASSARGAGVVTPRTGRASAPEADLAFHGTVSMTKGVMVVSLTPQNHGPADLGEAAVRLRWSVEPTPEPALPGGCVRTGQRTVLCRTGQLAAGSRGGEFEVRVRLADTPSEAGLRIETAWNGGAKDLNPENNQHDVLVLDTGDVYAF